MPFVEALGAAAVGWVAAPFTKDLIDNCKAYLDRDLTKALTNLETFLLPQFKLTIQAAQNSPNSVDLKKWSARLKNAYYDAEAILHDLDYDRLRHKAETAEKKNNLLAKLTSKMRKSTSEEEIVSAKKISSLQKNELWRCLAEFEELAAKSETFLKLLGIQISHGKDASAAGSHLKTTALALPDKVFGRDIVRDQIIEFLLQEQDAGCSRRGYSVVAITGIGGDGKTTLAQYIYNDESVKEYFGVRRIWLSLIHEKNIDIEGRTKETIEHLLGKERPNQSNETLLQDMLKETFMSDSKPVLLVLDDVWYDNDQLKAGQWDTLLAPFHSPRGKCKIVITSRLQRFPAPLRPDKHIPLQVLEDDDFHELFMHHALNGLENNIEPNILNELRAIGKQIAQKMSRSPLAAKVVGNQLHDNYQNTNLWETTLEKANMSDTVEVLRWSYERLDTQLQRCFLFFAVFPKGTRFTASEIVQYWVALDFIQHKFTSSYDNRSVMDIGTEYLRKMVANSIFQLVDGLYRMHDMYHDLAEELSAGDCIRVTDSEKAIPEDIVPLHVFIGVNNENLKEKLRSISGLRNLRTLILGNSRIEARDMSEIFSMISTTFKSLRVLEILSSVYITLPATVGDMRNLRCLKVNASLLELPESVSQLYHLQFIVLRESANSPKKWNNLDKLQSIEKYAYNKFNHVHTTIGWVQSRLIKDLFNKSITYLGSDITKGLEDLEIIFFPQFQFTIHAIQISPYAHDHKKWLACLKNAYYDAETILHNLEYDRLRCQVEVLERKKKKTLAKLTKNVSLFFKMLEQTPKKELRKHLKKLKEVAAEAKTLHDLSGDRIDGHLGTVVRPQKVFGRDVVRNQIIEFLLQDQEAGCSGSGYSVVAITGAGGDGKTTLAQYVCSDERVTEYFGVRMIWLRLPHENNIDIKKCTRKMIWLLTRKECPNQSNGTLLQNMLKETLMSHPKPVLLVLDDFWYDKDQSKSEQWDTLLAPFRTPGGRCKIVITSRLRSFPAPLFPDKHILLQALEDDDFQELLMHNALGGLENTIQPNVLDQFRNIGNQIARKMSRSPLAAKVVGNQLRENFHTRFWTATLENPSITLTKVLLRYIGPMESQLQWLFLFFAVFPKGTRFTASEMVQYWVALDFILHSSTTSDDNRSVEDIGLEYFNKMVAYSILCQGVDGWYTMHNMYHEIAEELSAGDYFRITDSEEANPKDTVLYMFIGVVSNEILIEILRRIPNLSNLRTLILGNPLIEDEAMSEICSIISTKFKNLRVLDIWSHGYRALPRDIGDLRHLRCLKIVNSSLKELPDSLSQLYHLQFLVLPESIKTLPEKLSNLVQLFGTKVSHVHASRTIMSRLAQDPIDIEDADSII